MSDLQQTRIPKSRPHWPIGTWILLGAGLLIFHLCTLWSGKEDGLWLPGMGVGLVLIAWLGQRVVILLALDLFLARASLPVDANLIRILGDSLLLATEMSLSWWIFTGLARGSRRLDDPRSATVFLILVPGAVAAALASIEALFWAFLNGPTGAFWSLVSQLWISRALGILTLAPALLVVLTPFLAGSGLILPDAPVKLPGGNDPHDWTWGDFIEILGLCLGVAILGIVMVTLHGSDVPAGTLWGIALLLVVWTSLRQGLRGGSLAAATCGIMALGTAAILEIAPANFSPLQGNLLAQSGIALLVGASAGWIRASEARYRQMVGHIPVVLYSSRLPRGLNVAQKKTDSLDANRDERKGDDPRGRAIVQQAEVTLVSPACRGVFDCPPEDLLGPYAGWLERIDPADRELVMAALAQLCLQKLPVTCEYRVLTGTPEGHAAPTVRWVRDTMVAFRPSEQSLDGWEGVIEDITEHRALGQNLRRINGMLQALVTHLPTGVFFVQGTLGQPVLVNQRARQLLGRREDPAAGITHLPMTYRLFKADGSEYPAEELPVAKALRQGITCTANDIVVHRADGRRVPLMTWAAPVNWTGMGSPDAAVWVLEDLSPLLRSETALHESERRSRTS